MGERIMRRWQLAFLGLSVAALAGWVGHWSGSISPRSFAQEPNRDAVKLTEAATGPDKGWIGLMVDGKAAGLPVVANIFPGGPSAFAGIRQGDTLLQVGGGKVQSEPQLAKAVEQLKPGEEVAVVVKRGEKELSLKVRVGSLRDFHSHYAREMWRRDPRDPNYAQSHGVSPSDLNIELARRLFEQNQRLEESLLELHKEVAALRSELKGKKTEGR
jgi:membrane-associated protease RseP (regulator of RpoE activity)